MENIPTIGFDGNDEIIFSQSFNVYENRLLVKFLGKSFKFIFENSEPKGNQKDVNVAWEDDNAVITLSKRFRNTLGSATTQKLAVLRTDDQRKVLMSIFGQQVGTGELLNVTISFYLR